jgi:predicted CopG family antitoxin
LKTITVEDKTWEALTLLKLKEKTSSLDETIQRLLREARRSEESG